MSLKGPLKKMQTRLENGQVDYTLSIGEEGVDIGQRIGKKVSLSYQGSIVCACGLEKKKVFRQNFCYQCFYTLPEASDCIFKPEKCRGHLGEGRDVEWEKEHHVQPHVVYLAYSSDVKVGVTREAQVPYRWMDQGATRAIILARVPNRYLAGALEVVLKGTFPDRTNWRKMLQGEEPMFIDLEVEKEKARNAVEGELLEFFTEDEEVYSLSYPYSSIPSAKLQSFDPVRDGSFQGTLTGIKGQYLVFEDGRVFNVRRYSGYNMEISLEE